MNSNSLRKKDLENLIMVDLDLEPFDFIRLQTVPQDGRTSEEIERRERKNKASRGETGVGPLSLSSSPLGNFALSSPAEP